MSVRRHLPDLLIAHGPTCRRCAGPIMRGDDIDTGHLLARVYGGSNDPRNLRPEHAECNRSAGATWRPLVSDDWETLHDLLAEVEAAAREADERAINVRAVYERVNHVMIENDFTVGEAMNYVREQEERAAEVES